MKKNFLSMLVMVFVLSSGCGAIPDSATKDTGNTKSNSNPGSDGIITLVMAHNQTSEENPYQYGMLKFKEELERISGGKMTATVHPGDLGTNEDELVNKLSQGEIDVVVVSPGFMTDLGVKEIDLLSLYYLYDDFDSWESVMDGQFGTLMKKVIYEHTERELYVLDYWSAGVRNYYGKKEISVPEDLAGLKIRTSSSPVQKEFWEKTGAIPVSVGWEELYDALNNGEVDAAENDFTNLLLKEHHKTANGKYICQTEHDFTTRLLLINGIKFNTYTYEQQQWIEEAAREATIEEREITYKKLNESIAAAEADGAVVLSVDKTPFMELAIPIQDAFAQENNMKDLLEMIRNSAK